MEFNEKLQELRNRKGITQEELAQKLYVSRAAISKWESGRGYPNIESLKAIAKFFTITIDDLLSGDELLTIAEEDSEKKERCLRDTVMGLLDCSVALFLFLPLFGQGADGTISAVSLIALTDIAMYMCITYYVVVASITAMGIVSLALRNSCRDLWLRIKNKISILLNSLGVLLFIISLQPYAAAFLFVYLMIKVLMLIKWR